MHSSLPQDTGFSISTVQGSCCSLALPHLRGELQENLSMEILKCGNTHTHSQGEQIHLFDPPNLLQNITQRHKASDGIRGLEHIHCSLPKLFPLDSARAYMEQLSTTLVAKIIQIKCEFPMESKHQPWQEGVTLD